MRSHPVPRWPPQLGRTVCSVAALAMMLPVAAGAQAGRVATTTMLARATVLPSAAALSEPPVGGQVTVQSSRRGTRASAVITVRAQGRFEVIVRGDSVLGKDVGVREAGGEMQPLTTDQGIIVARGSAGASSLTVEYELPPGALAAGSRMPVRYSLVFADAST